MKPCNKIKREILKQAANDLPLETDVQIEAAYVKAEVHWDYESDFREGEVETNILAEYNRHYEAKSVARKIDGSWVGWTYWYGGGKHGDPESIDWMEDAYDLDCVEEEKMVVVRIFARK